MENNFIEVQIIFNKENYEELYNALYVKGIENILEENGSLKVYFEEKSTKEVNALKKFLIKEKIISENDIEVVKLKNQNWNENWERSIEPVYIKEKIIVYPSWKKNELKNIENKILIEIDPKMSFGTGHNETTQLVLELMSDYIIGEEKKLLDFGTGTGILTIAGIKLGVESAVAIDIDDDSISNAMEYFGRNSVKDKVKLLNKNISQIEDDSFDVICANIIRSVIIDNIEHITAKINPKGKLFISGILSSEDQEILEFLTQYEFEVVDIIIKSEWIGIYAVKL
ncbi:MAG TPA: 50S ribosomal protein L11 methyltransferase [Ignavibacteria bacterium]|nr:50S ribosomal protein L11 methyltransferase [Ignavibacteria bacterium]